MNDPLGWLDEHARKREAAGLRRRLRPRVARTGLVDLAGNDYLGLARDARVTEAAARAARTWGGGSTGSRLVTGTTQAHVEFEQRLAEFVGAAAGLVFSSGYLANLGVITALANRGDLIVSDALNHASLIDGCRLSRARIEVVGHCDVAEVRRALAERREERAYVVTDAVFSVDGDVAPLAELAAACRAYNAVLIVDEAHGIGVFGEGGRGAVHAAGLAGSPDVVMTATLSKSLGAQGGVALGPAAVTAHLVDTARAFIFDTGLAPAAIGAADESLRILRADPGLADRVRGNARALYQLALDAGLTATPPVGAVTSVLIGDPDLAVELAAQCVQRGVSVGCFRPPSVPDGRSRLRLTARADLSASDLDIAAAALRAVAERMG
jgi:8-amino-7-oxononanoate synthase